ncbi:MAG: hypothetical protein ACOC9S_07680 [Planctomycetota bacterium]
MYPSKMRTFLRCLAALATSTWTGVVLLVALTVYVAVASIVAAVGDEADDLYRHPLLIIISAAMCANMLAATFTRVPTTVAHLGTFLSHGGVVILAVGAATFAFGRVQGDLMTVRTSDGWTPVNAFYVNDSHAVYVAVGQKGDFSRTAVNPGALKAGRAGPLNIADERISARAVDYAERTALLPVLQLRMTDADRQRRLELPAGTGPGRRVETETYVIAYRPDIPSSAAVRFVAGSGPVENVPEGKDLILIVGGDDEPPTALTASADGERGRRRLAAGEPVELTVAGEPLSLLLEATVLRPPEEHSADAPAGRAVAVRIASDDWQVTTWIPYADFTELVSGERVETPVGPVYLQYSRRKVSLGGVLRVREAEYLTQPGSVVPRDFRCDVTVETPQGKREAILGLNRPVRIGGLQISQGTWMPDPHHPMRIQLLVNSRPGLVAVWIGCGLTVVGLMYAFYVKPVVLRRKGRRA